MSYNFLNYDGKVISSPRCVSDSNVGYEANFSNNGEVDGWTYFDGIHTYGCWNNFLFGTLYGSYGVVGRHSVFRHVEAEKFYTVRVVMKLNMKERVGSQPIPSHGRVMWRTIGNPNWAPDKQVDFEIYSDTEWHTYYINMAEAQWWQGDVNDLRIYPIFQDGRDGDEFYIRVVEILSIDDYKCLDVGCDYYSEYEHNCPGIGERGYCRSFPLSDYVYSGTTFEFAGNKLYHIEKDVNDTLFVNINKYGFENVVLDPISNRSGPQLAKILAKEISKLDVGGYAECDVEYTDKGEFIIYNGVYADDSVVEIGDSPLARSLNFYNDSGEDISTKYVGRYPASGFREYSSFKLKTHQIYSLMDAEEATDFFFNPFIHNVEGGRRDWLDTGLGDPQKDIRSGDEWDSAQNRDNSSVLNRQYDSIDNAGKTIIDFTHPFNASGRITKVYAGVTLDTFESGEWTSRGTHDAGRKSTQLSGAKIMFFRPLKNGYLKVLDREIPIPDREHDDGKLYAAVQEYIELDCDLFVNKGDLIGVYNANVYRSRTISGNEIDALYYQIPKLAEGILTVRVPDGHGSAGLLMYARSDQIQHRLVLNLDLGHRVNVENLKVYGSTREDNLDYNVARCLDIDWQVDLFGEDHTTGYIWTYRPLVIHYYNHPNIYYGKNCLNDGIKVVPDGLAADSYSMNYGSYYYSWEAAIHKQNGGKGIIPYGAKYFHVNGDSEWLGVYVHANRRSPFAVNDFAQDPIAFTLIFPHKKEKLINKSVIYFKDRFNFRSFAISAYRGEFYTEGDADDPRFDLIPNRLDGTDTPWKRISLDGLDYTPEDEDRWKFLDLYLANNPCTGHIIKQTVNVLEHNYDGMAYFDHMGGLQYYALFKILNNAQYLQATAVDWTILEHEWEPLSAYGYRFYCDNHHSTKICEFEVFCVVENVTSAMAGSVEILYSTYGDYWWPAATEETDYGVNAFIGDTPRYVDIIVKPITEINLSDLFLDVSFEDVFMGEKGCQHSVFPMEVKRGQDTAPTKIDFKNVYGRSYDLYVDIASDAMLDEGAVFFSLMNDEDSVNNPIIGADAYYMKHRDYVLYNYQKNVAINCPVYALKNLLEGAQVWYSHDREYSWRYWGELTDGKNINFYNLPSSAITTINLPVLTRSKWWKIGFYDPRIVTKVREIQVYYDGEEIHEVKFYHHRDQDAISGGNTDTAPHLHNDIVDGSYYQLKGNYYIGFELPDVQKIDKLVIYQDFLLEYENSHDKAGIDSSTALCIHGTGDTRQTDTIVDVSYYEHAVTVVGSGIYCDEGSKDTYYDFTEDFANCDNLIERFTSATPDPEMWTDLVNASIVNEKLHVTNSGIQGEATTSGYFYNDFDVKVDLDIDGAYDDFGWGCYLEAFTDNGKGMHVGRKYHYATPGHAFLGEASTTGAGSWNTLISRDTEDSTGLKFKIVRVNTTTTCYAWDSDGTWENMGSSTVMSTSPVKFKLINIVTPFAYGKITTAKFDNFEVDKSNADWGVNTDYNSTFTCTEGIGPNGWAYYYDTVAAAFSNASGYKLPKIFSRQSYPLDHTFSFTFEFTFQASTFINLNDDSSTNVGVSVGLLGKHIYDHNSYDWEYAFTGAQIMLRRDYIGIVVLNDWGQITTSYASLNTRATTYYCRFTGDGASNYKCLVWTDDFDGANKVVDLSKTTSLPWTAYKIGVGSGYYPSQSYKGWCTGWVSDFNFYCDKHSEHHVINRSSIRFKGFTDERLLVDYDNSPVCNIVKEGFDLDIKRFTIDFFIKFSTLPGSENPIIKLFSCWDEQQGFGNGNTIYYSSSWSFNLEYVSGGYRWRFYIASGSVCRRVMDWSFYPDYQRWYHFYLCRGPMDVSTSYGCLLRDGHNVWETSGFGYTANYSGLDLVIGENLDGWMEEIRISSDYTYGGGRVQDYNWNYESLSKSVPWRQYERYYTMVLYDSSDNIHYGENMEVDVLFDNTYSYHEPFSKWSEKYYSYFAFDFGQRHDIEIVRSFPTSSAYSFSLNVNTFYSNKETTDPAIAFSLTEEEQELSTDFEGMDYDFPHNWTKLDTIRTASHIIDDSFYQLCNPAGSNEYCKARSKFFFSGNFDFHIDYDLGLNFNTSDTWAAQIIVTDVDNANNVVLLERSFRDGGNKYKLYVKDDSSSWTSVTSAWRENFQGTMRLERAGSIFKVYIKGIDEAFEDFVYLGSYQMRGGFNPTVYLELQLWSDSPGYPRIEVWWDNFTVTKAKPMYSSPQDTRWMRIKMLNGDGNTRIIKSLGVYPNVSSQQNAVGEYNTYWNPLGTAITSYASAENIALGATVSGSSYVGAMLPDNAVNGIIPEGEFESCWGSENESNPWLTIHFNSIQPIFRIKVYHGFSDGNRLNFIQDYRIQISTDGETFSTIFDINGNNSDVRTHDLSSPVNAKVVRFYVDKYSAINRFIWQGKDEGYGFWKGAVLREIEIYKYYGFTVINSEDTPIIAIDLRQPYFIDGHSLVGVDTENSEINWSNSDSNFAWSNSNLTDPHKVSFGEWGADPGYAKWAVIKRNTATHYPSIPTTQYPYRDTPDYLKHAVIKGSADESGVKPNAIEYPWMWRSNISELNYDYDTITNGALVNRSLRIDYPNGTDVDHVSFIEGDHFGWDEHASWRDGFGFYLYIDDIDNLDLEYGYFYLGGFDSTSQKYPVVHRWNMTTFSGVLHNGWNNLNLTFLYADEITYTDQDNYTGRDPRRLYSINWGRVGFVFRGTGEGPLQLNFEGLFIERNHFEHACYPGQYGLYLHHHDMLKVPIGELDFHSAAIEFWIRPDWNWDGRDIYKDFKFRTLFHFGNVANDIFGVAISARGLEVYYGNLLTDFNMFIVSGFNFNSIDQLFHMAFVFSNDGTGIDADNSSIRVYINNEMIAKSHNTWEVSDDKHFNFILGGQGLIVQKAQGFDPMSSAVDAVVCRLKVHNYCKTDFSDSINDSPLNYQRKLLKPSSFVEISRDNVTYHKVDSADLPFFFDDVPNGASIPIWVKVHVPKELTGMEKRTSKIIGSWDIGV